MPHMITILVFFIVSVAEISFYVEGSYNRREAKKCEYGKSWYDKKTGDFVNGRPVVNNQKYPWIVNIHHIEHQDEIWEDCSGALISLKFVLTAAVCLVKYNAPINCLTQTLSRCYVRPKDILIGILGKNKTQPDRKVVVSKVIPHPDYLHGVFKNDIALIKLKRRLACSTYITPICLDSMDFLMINETLTVAGFVREENNVLSHVLREGTIKLIKSDLCAIGSKMKPENIFCAVGISSPSICLGESGSVVFAKKDGVYYAIGVTSVGSLEPLCYLSTPKFYTKVYAYMEFIKKHVPAINTASFKKKELK